MSRSLLVVLIVAFVGVGNVQAQPSASGSQKATKAKKLKRATKKTPKRAKHRRKRKRRRRTPNVPAGWSWPPNKAMVAQGKACRERLTELGVHWKPAKRRRNIATPIVVPDMKFGGIALEPKFRKPPFVMDCHLAESLAKAGPALAVLGVRALRFSSIHSFRRVRTGGRTKGALSRHAYGLAVDVYEVDPIDGERLTILQDYRVMQDGELGQPPGAALLSQIEREGNASGQFRLLLTPANDPKSHYDHFHFEARIPSMGKTQKRKRRRKRAKGKRRRKRAI